MQMQEVYDSQTYQVAEEKYLDVITLNFDMVWDGLCAEKKRWRTV